MKKVILVPALMVLAIAILATCQKKEKIAPPDQIISIAQAKEMYDNYTDRRVPCIKEFEDSLGKPNFYPTRYMEYDLKVMKQYIAYIEDEADMAGVEIETLRIYQANYGDKDEFKKGGKVKYSRQNTTFIVPTTKNGDENLAFYTVDTLKGKKKVMFLKGLGKKLMEFDNLPLADIAHLGLTNSRMLAINFLLSAGATIMVEPDENSLILNDANLIPPPDSTEDDMSD